MLKVLNALNTLFGTVLALAIVGLISYGGWTAYRTYYGEMSARQETEQKLALREAELARLAEDLEAKQRQLDRLETAMKLLKVDRRVARLSVLDQQGSQAGGDLRTQFSFVEVDENGKELERPRTFSIKGDLVYIDAWVVKFTDQLVEEGDPLRSASICLFRRIFGEEQRPTEGFQLDPVGSEPAAYRTAGQTSPLEQELWSKFWDYANDANKARAAGVRAAHGEAPSIKLVPRKQYKIQLRASDGLSIVPEDQPQPPPRERPTTGAEVGSQNSVV